MLQNARVATFTISELLRENQLGWDEGGGGLKLPPTQIRVSKKIEWIMFYLKKSTVKVFNKFKTLTSFKITLYL